MTLPLLFESGQFPSSLVGGNTYGTLQSRHTAAPLTRLVGGLYMDQGSAEERCRHDTCQEISGDVTSTRDTP
jgi:hypothetical protein